MTLKINLTPLRLRALRMIQQRPGLSAQALAVELVERREVTWSDKGWNGFQRSRTGAQAATRWGARYAKPLIDAGLLRASDKNAAGHRIYSGWKALFLTPLGEVVARDGRLPDSAET